MFRPWYVSVAGLMILAACSGADASPPAEPTVAPSTTAVAPDEAPAAEAAPTVPAADAKLPAAESVPQVSVRVAASGFEGPPVDTEVTWSDGATESAASSAGDEAGSDPSAGDPFGRFGSCSGLRTNVGSYSVLVSGADELESVNVWTSDQVFGAGIHDAEVRVERAGSAPIVASGTLTLLDGLQQGEFLAFGPAGGRVEGTFSCVGTPPPTPLRSDSNPRNGVEAVEVFALLRAGEAERVLALAADASSGARCPLVEGDTSDTVAGAPIVDVVGDRTVGGITSFELTGGPAPSASLRAGGSVYELDGVELMLDDSGASGAFSGVATDGVVVDGAFRCA